jgi:hypothetical protein
MASRLTAEVNATVAAYRGGQTMQQIATAEKVDVGVIFKRIIAYQQATGEWVERHYGRSKVDIAAVLATAAAYRDGKRIREVAADNKVSPQRISQRIKLYEQLTGETVIRRRSP